MSRRFFGHPLSSYTQKALIALYEHGVDFEWRLLSPENPEIGAEFAEIWPMQLMPVLDDGGRVLRESSIIVEYVDTRLAGAPRLIPADRDAALEVRFFDRVFDNYVMTPVQQIVFDRIRPEGERDPYGVAAARERLERAYAWLETALPEGGWAAGGDFSLADCAAAPSLFYASYVQPFGDRFPRLAAYLERLEARPSNARCRAEARPYWHLFPFADQDAG